MKRLLPILLIFSSLFVHLNASDNSKIEIHAFQDSIKMDSLRVYVNIGYLSSFIIPDDCTRPDVGGSFRIGILSKKRFGYYLGYTWFNEFHENFIEYDDKGRLFIAGIDYQIMKKKEFQIYVKAGLAMEQFISTYPSRTETETSIKPDFGILLNIKKFNAYIGWQPSDPSHYNIGIGYTFKVR